MHDAKEHSHRRLADHSSVGSTAERRGGWVRIGEAGARLSRDWRSCASESRIASASRIFSGQDSAFLLLCHCAALSRRSRTSLIAEPRFEPSPGLRQSVLRSKARDLLTRRSGRLEQREDTSVVLRAPDAQRDRSEVVRPHDAKRNALEVRRICVLQGLLRKRAERRHELHRPGADTDGIALRGKAPPRAEIVDACEHVHPLRRRHRDEYVRIEGSHRLGVAHLRHRPEQGVVLDHARGLHLVEKLRQLLHRTKLSHRAGLEAGSQVRAILGSARLLEPLRTGAWLCAAWLAALALPAAAADTRELQERIDTDLFGLPAPASLGAPLKLWATWYHVHAVEAIRDGVRLLDITGAPISPPVPARDWCLGALQGVIMIKAADGTQRTYAETRTFEAYVVADEVVKPRLHRLHALDDSTSTPAGTLTIETTPAYKAPVAVVSSPPLAEAAWPNAAVGDWPSYNRTPTSQRYSPAFQNLVREIGAAR